MDLHQKLRKIKAICSDIDGVLTDGSVLIQPDGTLLRSMSVYDGMGIKKALDEQLILAFFTGGSAEGIYQRLNSLGVEFIYRRLGNKLMYVEKFRQKNSLHWDEILYIGDDIIDIPVLKKAGVKVAPANATDDVKQIVDFITTRKGGEGALRETIELVLKIQNKWKL